MINRTYYDYLDRAEASGQISHDDKERAQRQFRNNQRTREGTRGCAVFNRIQQTGQDIRENGGFRLKSY